MALFKTSNGSLSYDCSRSDTVTNEFYNIEPAFFGYFFDEDLLLDDLKRVFEVLDLK